MPSNLVVAPVQQVLTPRRAWEALTARTGYALYGTLGYPRPAEVGGTEPEWMGIPESERESILHEGYNTFPAGDLTYGLVYRPGGSDPWAFRNDRQVKAAAVAFATAARELLAFRYVGG